MKVTVYKIWIPRFENEKERGKENSLMSEVRIIPQKFSFQKPNITDAFGNIKSPGIIITIELDAFRADKQIVKKNLESIFTEVLGYFD